MKNSLIPKKHLVPGKKYWCAYNSDSVLCIMKNIDNDIFEIDGISETIQNIRVMFEGYVNINKSRIPTNFLCKKRHYWCRYSEDNDLSLMRYDGNNKFYSIRHDVFWDSKKVKVIFEDYEH